MTQHDPTGARPTTSEAQTQAGGHAPRPTHDPTQDPTAGNRARAVAGFGAAIADPGPLGLAGFAATTFFLSAVNTNMLPDSVGTGVLGLAVFYGGIAQLLAGMWEFTKGNTFGAVAFTSFGAFWLSYWYLVDHVVPGWLAKGNPTPPKVADINHALGAYLLVWTIFTAYMFIASLRTSAAVAAVFLALTLTFLFLTIGKFNADLDGKGMTGLGGYLGLVTAILAWYGSFAAVTNSTFKKTVLPVIPLARSNSQPA